jgi:hypothetical protein
MLFAAVTVCALFFGSIQPERPPRPIVPSTERDKQILKLASSFVASKGAIDYQVPVRIEPSHKNDGTVVVIYWTPSGERRLLGERAVVVNPESGTVEFVPRA